MSFLHGLQAVNGPVYSIAVAGDGKVLIGGQFQSVNGQPRGNVARLNPDGTLDNGFLGGMWGADFAVYSLVLASDGKVVIGGEFTTVNGASRNRVARLNSDGSLDAGFLEGLPGLYGYEPPRVYSVALQADGKVLIGGVFTNVNGVARNRLARLHSDGTVDTNFQGLSSPYDRVRAIIARDDGSVLIGGEFHFVNGLERNCIAQFRADGSLDDDFSNALSADSQTVSALAVQPDGKILIGGWFSHVNGQPRHAIARLNADGTPDSSFIGATNLAVYSIVLSGDGRLFVASGLVARLWGDRFPPALNIEHVNDTAVVSWPITFLPFQLQERDSLTTGVWSSVAAASEKNDGRFSVRVPFAGRDKFFRLEVP